MQLLQAFAREFQFAIRCFLGLFDKGVKHDYAPADHEAVKRTANSFAASGAQFEQPVAERSRMRQPQIRSMFYQHFRQSRVIRKYVDRPCLDVGEHAFMEIFDFKRHAAMLANA